MREFGRVRRGDGPRMETALVDEVIQRAATRPGRAGVGHLTRRGHFPFRLAGQTRARPGRKRVRLVVAHVTQRLEDEASSFRLEAYSRKSS